MFVIVSIDDFAKSREKVDLIAASPEYEPMHTDVFITCLHLWSRLLTKYEQYNIVGDFYVVDQDLALTVRPQENDFLQWRRVERHILLRFATAEDAITFKLKNESTYGAFQFLEMLRAGIV